MRRIKEWIQKRKSRPAAWPRNMAVLYLLCIILPLFVTDTIFVAMLIRSGRTDRNYKYEKSAENMAFSFGKILENASAIAMNVTKNEGFEDFLEKDYNSGLDYYDSYNTVMGDEFLKALCSINASTFEIYTDNPTIVNGGGIYNLNRVSHSSWYKEFKEKGQETFVKFYYETETAPSAKPRRMLMLLRRMDYYPRGHYKKICRIVIDYGAFTRSMESAAAGSGGYISDDEYAYFFTEGNNYMYDDFMKASDIKGRIGYSRDFIYAETPFRINITEDADSGFDILLKGWPLLLVMLVVNAIFPIFFARLTRTVAEGKLAEQEMDIARQQAELLALHSQINPHFLFNALESIRMHSVLRGENETAQMVEKLAVIERRNANWDDDNTTVENEMDFVDAYLGLQKYRFGDRLSYEVDVEEACKKVTIPKLSIVTFVENACVHGIEEKSSPGWIFVRVYKRSQDMIIEIEDTGGGLSDEDAAALHKKMENASLELLKSKGRIGVVNACLRLKMATEDRVRFSVESEKGIGTTVTVVIPGECVHEKSIAG
ncbi:MAG: histidine kinase [Lachnospiraceae bacterium]|nr:histidine kinase [Lachnospiraceae bacterium]